MWFVRAEPTSCEQRERNWKEAADTRPEERGREIENNPPAAGVIGFMKIRSCQDDGEDGGCPKFGKKTSTVKSAIPSRGKQGLSERFNRIIPGAQPIDGCARGKSWKAVHPLEDSPATISSTFANSTISVPPPKPWKYPVVPENLVETCLCSLSGGHSGSSCHINMIRVD
jgi:hypothetical protein